MELQQKLAVLADAAKYDASCASGGLKKARAAGRGGIGSVEGSGICHAYTPDGRCISLLKILLTNYCIYDCAYCINRRSSNVVRARFSVAEVVGLTLDFYRRNYIEGLFLSSGIIRDSDHTMHQLIAVARTLRLEHRFHGYIHLKTIPDASPELLDEAGLWADRVSMNVELPSQRDLDALAPEKQLVQIRGAMGRMTERIASQQEERRRYAPAGQSTQLIVGATPSSDHDVLTLSHSLYDEHRLRRVYYSAFSPIQDASAVLPARPAPLLREHRLYQADWLLRFYGFGVNEIVEPGANLSLRFDPKTEWALRHRALFPVDVNLASREELLRVPGLGVRTVDRLLVMRLHRAVRSDDLVRLRVPVRRALPFVVTADRHGREGVLDSMRLVDALSGQAAQMELWEGAAA